MSDQTIAKHQQIRADLSLLFLTVICTLLLIAGVHDQFWL